MSTPMKRYRESTKNTPGPISLTDLEYTCDIPGIFAYAKSKGVSVEDLSEEEKRLFLKRRLA